MFTKEQREALQSSVKVNIELDWQRVEMMIGALGDHCDSIKAAFLLSQNREQRIRVLKREIDTRLFIVELATKIMPFLIQNDVDYSTLATIVKTNRDYVEAVSEALKTIEDKKTG